MEEKTQNEPSEQPKKEEIPQPANTQAQAPSEEKPLEEAPKVENSPAAESAPAAIEAPKQEDVPSAEEQKAEEAQEVQEAPQKEAEPVKAAATAEAAKEEAVDESHPEATAATSSDGEMLLAGAFRRSVGGVIDLVFIMGISFLVGGMFGATEVVAEGGQYSANVGGAAAGLGFLIAFLLMTFMEWGFGKTIGKLILGMKVVSEDYTKITFGQALKRNLLRIIDGLFMYLVGLIIILIDKKNQRLGDLVAKTYVVKA